MKIVVYRRACDGFHDRRVFKTLAGARRFAQDYVGKRPEFGTGYAVSFDGIATVRVDGATLRDLFPEGL